MTHHILRVMAVAAGLTLAACTSERGSKADAGLCFSGGPIYTANDAAPKVMAVAVRGKIITYAGADKGDWCNLNAGEGARRVYLGGAAMFPGFTDGHGHLMEIGVKEMSLKLTDIRSIPALQARLSEAVATTPKGETIFSRGWIETFWPEGRFPTRQDLDAVSPDHPVVLERADGHAVVINTAMMTLAGITRDTPSPSGGEILKDANGEPTGMLIDKAAFIVLPYHPTMTAERKRRAYTLGAELYASRGWTNIHAMSVDPNDLALMAELVESDAVPLRVYNAVLSPEGQFMPGSASVESDLDQHMITRGVKLYTDGALGSRGAALLAPYSDDPGNVGIMRMEREPSLAIFKEALRTGTQLNVHAIGDKANRELLDWYEDALAAVPVSERAVAAPRWRVEHAQILSPEDLGRFVSLGILPSMQPSHAIGDLHFAVDRLGVERLRGGYAWQSLLTSGGVIIGGTDAPVEVGDPMIEFYAARTRRDLEGYSAEGWYPDEAVSAQDALKMFTIWPAYGAFQDHELGSIEVGKRADFSVFDRDIMVLDGADILDTKAVMTVVDGRVIYERAKAQ